MNKKADRMIINLTPEIELKCQELQSVRRERRRSVMFALMCAAVVLLPSLLIFIGISPLVFILPPAVMSLGMILLLPTLVSGRGAEKGENAYE